MSDPSILKHLVSALVDQAPSSKQAFSRCLALGDNLAVRKLECRLWVADSTGLKQTGRMAALSPFPAHRQNPTA
jgi:hypothetical protein